MPHPVNRVKERSSHNFECNLVLFKIYNPIQRYISSTVRIKNGNRVFIILFRYGNLKSANVGGRIWNYRFVHNAHDNF